MSYAAPLELKSRWFMPAVLLLIVLLSAVVTWTEPYIAPAAAHQKALLVESFARGGLAGYAEAAVHAAAWVFVVIVFRPMLLLAAVVLIESRLASRGEERKNLALAWTVRAAFLIFAYALGLLLARSLPALPGPLFDFTDSGSPSWLRTAQMAVLLLITVLATDFFQYWAHRSFHRFRFLWKFHAVHHSPRDLDVLHAFQHPVEAAATWFLVALPLGALIAGVDAGQFSLLAAFFLVQSHLAHTKAPVHLGPLGGLLVDNRFHFIHHSREPRHFDRNFAAIFPVFDRIFGTYCKPEPGPLPKTGLGDRLPPQRLSHYFLAHLPPEDRQPADRPPA
ncbi:sterol desaturase family protein [Allosphingosinicella sp.]|jgi:sterol desaturase/sphingolipid hydroxylase (fatty acid hydroxylase superfamily)|uniref:sterol desaturase family protein n=1 Tax=Allosphingosinicella sp. TaxID=2823234 RepID=UPI002EFC18F1